MDTCKFIFKKKKKKKKEKNRPRQIFSNLVLQIFDKAAFKKN